MNRTEAEDFIYRSYMKAEKYQDYQAKDAMKRRPDLTRDLIRSLAGTPCVIVTGSKGKGSVANMISRILQTQYKVGLMTSPHMVSFCERFKINDTDLSDERFTEYVNEIAPAIEAIDASVPKDVCISPIGIQAVLALTCFRREGTGFNVLECGKGVRFDDVGNVLHEYAVINSIFPEHLRELGSTVEEIASDKAHVITGEQKAVFTAAQKESVLAIIRERADRMNVPLYVYGEDFSAENIRYTSGGMVFDVVIGKEHCPQIQIPLLGEHQAKNCALAMAMAKEALGELDLPAIRAQLKKLDWPGRMEVIGTDPVIMLDACINRESCAHVREVLGRLNITDVTAVIGIPDDKDFAGVAMEMAKDAKKIILTKSQNPHYVFTQMQQERLKGEGIEAFWTDRIEDAVALAKDFGNPVMILGTTSVVAEVKKLQKEQKI